MRFRVKHLLALAVFVCVFSAAFAVHNELWVRVVALLSWFSYLTMICRAFLKPEERPVLVPALVFGLSYLALEIIAECYHYDSLIVGILADSFAYFFEHGNEYWWTNLKSFVIYLSIGKFAVSFGLATIGGALGAYWSRDGKKE